MASFLKIKEMAREGVFREMWKEAKWLWQYIRAYRSAVWIHILLGVLSIVMGLGVSVATKYLIDAVTGYRSERIWTAVAMMIGMQLTGILLRSIAGRISAALQVRVINGIRQQVYGKILRADWESLEQYREGDLLHRLDSDTNAVAGAVTGFLPSLLSGTVQFVGAFLIILYYDAAMALIAVLGVPVTAVLSRLLLRRMRKHSQEMKALQSDVMAFNEDSFQNITSIKAFGVVGLFQRRMEKLQDRYREAYLDFNRFSVWTSAFLSLVSLVVSGCCFGWGVYRLWSGAISYGSMTMFLQLSNTLASAFSTLTGLVPTAISVTTSAGRIMSVTELPLEDAADDAALRAEQQVTVRLSHVDFSYQNGDPVLRDATMTALPGELISVTGPSGDGKTTLIRLLLGLVRPAAGEAVLEGASGACYPLSAATRCAFSYVPQGNTMFDGTIRENLRLTNQEATDQELQTALELACAWDFVQKLPGGLDHVIGTRGKGISEGQAQRLAIARALLRPAPVLLLDEATSALDQETEARLLSGLMSSGRIRTCILVTHRPAALAYCSRRYEIIDGCVREVRL